MLRQNVGGRVGLAHRLDKYLLGDGGQRKCEAPTILIILLTSEIINKMKNRTLLLTLILHFGINYADKHLKLSGSPLQCYTTVGDAEG